MRKTNSDNRIKIPEEVREYWESVLADVDKPIGYKEITFDPAILNIIIMGKNDKKARTTPEKQKLLAGFYKVFGELPKKQQDALNMYFGLLGQPTMKEKEIAEEMGVTQQEVSKLIKKGKIQLKKRIETYLSVLNTVKQQ